VCTIYVLLLATLSWIDEPVVVVHCGCVDKLALVASIYLHTAWGRLAVGNLLMDCPSQQPAEKGARGLKTFCKEHKPRMPTRSA
jgi:hypothetical protein